MNGEKMRILLVRPPRIEQSITLSDFMFSEPLGLEMIYGALKEEHDIEIFDMMIEDISLSMKIGTFKPDTVGITSLCIDVIKVIELCAEAKKADRKIITVVGGTQAYLNPEAFYHETVDHIFQYTSSENLKIFYDGLSIGKIQKADGVLSRAFDYEIRGVKGYNQYLAPDRSSTAKYREKYSYFGYRPAAIMEFGTGCEKGCDFCLRWRIEGIKEKLIDRELTKKDLLSIEEPSIMFIDNDFFASREKIEGFIQLIKELKIKKNYIIYGSVEGSISYKEYLEELAEIGLKAIIVGYETFNDAEMTQYLKNSTTLDNRLAAKVLKDSGIDVWASFMAHPDWSKKDFEKLRAYIKVLKPQISSISPLTPFPGLPMYAYYEDRLLYKAEDYEKWSFGQVMIEPSQISLRSYYYELLKTSLYVNICINNNTEMIKSFGGKNVFRIIKGSIKAAKKYFLLAYRGN